MKRSLVALGLCVLVLPLFAASHVSAQSANAKGPAILITWKPLVYTPPGFEGRALPIANSRIIASAAVIDNGRLANLNGQTIYWYLNDEFIEGTANKQTIEFRTPSKPNTRLDLRVEIPTYGTTGGILQTIEIPSLLPVVVIDAPFPKKTVSGESFQVRALPYFFNVGKISFLRLSWLANGKSATNEDPTLLTVRVTPGTPSGYRTSLNLSANNPFGRDTFEQASNGVALIFVQ